MHWLSQLIFIIKYNHLITFYEFNNLMETNSNRSKQYLPCIGYVSIQFWILAVHFVFATFILVLEDVHMSALTEDDRMVKYKCKGLVRKLKHVNWQLQIQDQKEKINYG